MQLRTWMFPNPSSHRVFYYHQVWAKEQQEKSSNSGSEPFYPEGISIGQFEEQIIALQKAGFQFIPLSQGVLEAGCGRKQGLTVSLTTDDGFACNYHQIMPLLQKHDVPLTLFLIGTCLNNQSLAWNHKLLILRQNTPESELRAALRKLAPRFDLIPAGDLGAFLFSVPMTGKDALADELWERFLPFSQTEYLAMEQPFLSDGQVLELVAQGAEIASHSFSHPDFSRLGYSEARKEIELADQALGRYPQPPVKLFAFPYGKTCSLPLLRKLARDTGIKAFFGGRFIWRDNRGSSLLWQRQKMEQSPPELFRELTLKPWLRILRPRF